MAKKGSVTLFFALILSLMLSLVLAGMESVRTAAARTQTLCGVDIGLYSLFGQYDRQMLKDYDVFFLDGSCGGGEVKPAKLYDNLEAYIRPVLEQNGQDIRITQGGFTGYRLATDDGGEVFYRQVVEYMSDTLGSQGVQLLLDHVSERREETRRAEEIGNNAESADALDHYDSEMNQAAASSQAAVEAAREEAARNGQELNGSDFLPADTGKKVVNPVTIIKRIRKRGILELVIPYSRAVSENSVKKKTLVSGRKLQTGLFMPGESEKDTSYTSQLLFLEYLMRKLGNYSSPADNGLRYQLEYILNGKDSDLANLKAMAARLLIIREGVNFVHLMADSLKRAEAAALALTIASTFLIPPAAGIIESALLLCWSFAESVLDVRELFDGGRVPLVKSSADWQLSLNNLPYLLDGLDTLRRGTDHGMSYEDYLQVLLLTKGKEEKLQRGMDMIEASIRSREGRDSFQLDSCIAAMEISVDVETRSGRTFTATRQYCYNQ